MRWSKLKQQVETNFAPCVQGRVELFQTRYRHARDGLGEAWLTVDGERKFSWGEISFLQAERAAWDAILPRATRPHATREELFEASDKVSAALEELGPTMLWILNEALLHALSLSFDLMLKHRSPIIRGLAMLDRRLGKRRLRALDTHTEHPFVRSMFEFRCEAEGINTLTLHGSTASRSALR